MDGNSFLSDKVEGETFLEALRVISPYPSVSERYYKPKLYPCPNNNDHSNQDLMVLGHSNKISIITLAPSHDILSLKKTIKCIDFGTEKANRLNNRVKGKWKKGAQKVNKESVLCSIECDDGVTYKINACISGKIVEINRRLLKEPSLLTNKPWSDGFIAILMPPFQPNKTPFECAEQLPTP